MTNPPGDIAQGHRAGWVVDLAVVLGLVGLVIANAVHSPGNACAHSQWRQMGAAVATMNTGQWLLPRNQIDRLPSKPQLYAWLTVPVLRLTGLYTDFAYRFPSVVAALVMGVLVYLLGRRWYGRGVGLLAACMWATAMHMSRLMYLGTTDMLVTLWTTLSIFCADRLLFHRAPRRRRPWWALGLWASMILGALTKGWGALNLVLVGAMLGLACATGPGFKALGAVAGPHIKALLAGRLVLRRWRSAAKAVRLLPGLVVFLVVIGSLVAAQLAVGGHEFRRLLDFEILSRVAGGLDAPQEGGTPAVLALLYYNLPVVIFAVVGLLQVSPRRWFCRRGGVWLPVCWILAVLIPFSMTHGFRADYLLPCYAATAILGAWSLGHLLQVGRDAGRAARALRHVVATVAIFFGLVLVVMSLVYVYHQPLLDACRGQIHSNGKLLFMAAPAEQLLTRPMAMPRSVEPETWWITQLLPAVGLIVIVLAVRASLRWKIRRLGFLTVVAMLGVMFVDRHFLTRHAKTGDGATAFEFARRIDPKIGHEAFAVCGVHRLATEPYLGRFGRYFPTLESLPSPAERPRWLVTTDEQLILLHNTKTRQPPDPAAAGTELHLPREHLAEAVVREHLGSIVHSSPRIVGRHLRAGRMHLIELRRP